MAAKHVNKTGVAHKRGAKSARKSVRQDNSGRRSNNLSAMPLNEAAAPKALRRGVSRKWAMRFLLFLALLGVLGVAAFYVYASNLLSVETIQVSGVRHLTAEEMTSLAAVPVSSTLLRVDTAAIEERLKSNSWVEDVRVNRVFPHTLELEISERPISAIVEVVSVEAQDVESWAISHDGMWLVRIPVMGSQDSVGMSTTIYDDAASVLHITDVPLDVHPEAGTICNDESVLNALAIVSGFSTSLADQVVVVSATDTANTLLTLENGVQIAFGTAEDIRDKERVCLQLMEQYADQISYINVRVVERPTWRAVSSW